MFAMVCVLHTSTLLAESWRESKHIFRAGVYRCALLYKGKVEAGFTVWLEVVAEVSPFLIYFLWLKHWHFKASPL